MSLTKNVRVKVPFLYILPIILLISQVASIFLHSSMGIAFQWKYHTNSSMNKKTNMPYSYFYFSCSFLLIFACSRNVLCYSFFLFCLILLINIIYKSRVVVMQSYFWGFTWCFHWRFESVYRYLSYFILFFSLDILLTTMQTISFGVQQI